MRTGWLIILALFLYVSVVVCAVWSGAPRLPGAGAPSGAGGPSTMPLASLEGLPYRSISILLQRTDWMDKYKKCIDQIAEIGADTVMVVVDARQENGGSAVIYLDVRETPSVEQLSDLIQYAKSKKLRVILMPYVLLEEPRGGEWRGKIEPTTDNGGWEKWFDSYRAMITHFAYIAQSNGVNVLVIGSELVSSENKVQEWTKTIHAVRKIYKGQLTYSSNWDHYTAINFWNQLDLIGMNSYWKFGEEKKNPDPSLDHIVDRWHDIQKDLLDFQKKNGKALVFLEIGWFSQSNVAYEPWDYTQESIPVNLDLQRRLYEGFFRAWYGNVALGGFSVWQWSPDEGGPDDKGYTPHNKPAEKVLRDWLAKPRWDVKP